jgi:hypothetical protein
MKQKDIALIIVIAAISAIVSFIVSGKIFVTPANRQQKVEVVDKISTEFVSPSKKYFSSNSIDPTQAVQIGNDSNQNPFNGTSQ